MKHWERWRRHGDPNISLAGQCRNLAERFWEKAAKTDIGCWYWLGTTDRGGYGRFKVGGKKGTMVPAHRTAYELAFGPIPLDMEIDHLCSNRNCVRPDHLEVVDRTENNRRRHWGLEGVI